MWISYRGQDTCAIQVMERIVVEVDEAVEGVHDGHYTRSSTIAMPWPTPMHMVQSA